MVYQIKDTMELSSCSVGVRKPRTKNPPICPTLEHPGGQQPVYGNGTGNGPARVRKQQPDGSATGAPEFSSLSREERRRRRRATLKYRTAHATRERIRVEAFNVAFSELRKLLPTLPPDKKLSKIEILKLAICYISYLNHVLDA
ncbi:helix-loop-helix protein 1 [Anopheles ziemanni]|uniref:helix-loop-helix protein 1 n=1 Tax=Anopheles coustani TaxID=139045 RepID=UPI002658BB89|nr:helix-loop-helix protein 1 [Anopheles coustani]XP_058166988.1 helix-loop-helix protein 1 [Anopheles ziemanni]